MVFICTQMLSVRVGSCFGDYYWRCFKCVAVTSSQTNHHNRSPSLVRHTYHCPLICVQIGQPIEMSNTFSCLFLLFMLTLPLHEVMIPLFFSSFFSSTNGSLLLFVYLFPFYPTSPFLF